MLKLIIDKISRIIRNKKQLEEKLNVKISNRGKEVYLEGSADDEYIAQKVIEALDFGFPFSAAMQIKENDFIFERLNIKDYTKRHDLERIRARIIGTNGKTLKTLSSLTEGFLELKDNEIGIISEPEFLEVLQQSIISIIQGSKTTNVYSYLEKHRPKPIEDLGLKGEK